MSDTTMEQLYNETAAHAVLNYLYDHDMYSLAKQFCVECPYINETPNLPDRESIPVNVLHKPLLQLVKEYLAMESRLQILINLCSSVVDFPQTESSLVLVEHLIDMLELYGTANILDQVISAGNVDIESTNFETPPLSQLPPLFIQLDKLHNTACSTTATCVSSLKTEQQDIIPIIAHKSSTPINKQSENIKTFSAGETAERSSSCSLLIPADSLLKHPPGTNASLEKQEPTMLMLSQPNKVTAKQRLKLQTAGNAKIPQDDPTPSSSKFISSNRSTNNRSNNLIHHHHATEVPTTTKKGKLIRPFPSSLPPHTITPPGSPESFVDPLTVCPLTPRFLTGPLSILSPSFISSEMGKINHIEYTLHSNSTDIQTPVKPMTPGSSLTPSSTIESPEHILIYHDDTAPMMVDDDGGQEDRIHEYVSIGKYRQ